MIEGIHPRRGSALTMRLRKKKSLLDQAIDQASDVVDAALPRIESAVSQAREQLREISKDTKVKAAPLVAEGRSRAADLAADLAETTREVAIPKAKAAALAGADRTAELAASGRDFAASKLAETKGEPPKRKGRKIRRLLVFGSLAAAAGFIYNKMRPQPQVDNWQSSYTPPTSTTTSSTTSTGTSAAGVPTTGGTHLAPGVGPDEPMGSDDPMTAHAGDDTGGASPDEAIADAVEEPHEVTTPDDPAEVVDVESEAKKK
jgi:hypothetical protein